MSEEHTLMENSAMYAVIVAFPFADRRFMVGCEAGMLWRDLWSGKDIIEAVVGQEIQEGVAQMAAHCGYDCEFKPCNVKGYTLATLKNVERRDPDNVAEYIVGRIERIG
jgi:hypothetical protein